ncbi:DUF917 domain-containing protein [Vibrio breoganii]|uniref:DUF917 domain-containing protein n=1 Tax=Vibrio breoganii TaxID=553239 RepID=UPI000C835C6C|nr:DUF917 domain-containing protein [Vibrio breoganii]PMG05468.1 hypothetical protein BCV00_12930 [Vibrio breoganii]PML15934.1 hypothetical protein BCT84_07310 [Vibrio breoganii]
MIINEQMIDDIALGATVLGTGGGGDPYSGALMAKAAIAQSDKPVEMISLEEVDDNCMTVPSSMIGAPTVAIEKINSKDQMLVAFEAMEKALDEEIAVTFPIEVGGFNSLIPILVAAQKGIPVVDCDAMGRAFPESQMVTFYLDGLPSAPNTLADEKGNVVTIHPLDGVWSERFARPITEEMGGSAAMCDYPMRGFNLKKSALPGTLTKAMQIGKAIRKANADGESAVDAVLDIVGGQRIVTGKILDIHRTTAGGFVTGGVVIEKLQHSDNDHQPKSVFVHFQNELLLAHKGSSADELSQENLLATTPDLISILDHETGHPITTEQLHYGQRVDLIAYPCDPKWRTDKGIEVAGPNYFGYAVDYQTIETLLESGGN